MADLEDVADAMVRHEDPVVKAADIAEVLDDDVTSRHVLDLLRSLERIGEVESKQIGGRAVAWWHVDRVAPPHVPAEDHPAQTSLKDEPAARADAHATEDTAAAVEHEPAGAGDDDLDQDLAALDLPGSGNLLDVRREAVRGCYELLRREGSASKSDFIAEVYESDEFDRAGYETSAGWWNTIGKKGLKQLAERRDDLEAPAGEGVHQWRLVEKE